VNGARTFEELFGKHPAAVANAPGRVNLIGDHTDYNQGYVLPTVIPQRTLVEAAIAGDRHQVYSAILGRLISFDGGALTDFARYIGGCIRVIEARGVNVSPLQLRIDSDVPVGAGLSSSAALEVATIRVLGALLGLDLPAVEIALLAHKAEVEYAGVACGIMDQMACSLGRAGEMLFLDTMTLERRLVALPAGGELLIVNSGIPRALAGTEYN
jgi:galactokinase